MRYLTEFSAQKLLGTYGVPLPKAYLANDASTAARFASRIGFPVVLKLMSPDILHKSDAGCVKTNIRNSDELAQAFSEITDNAKKYNPRARIDGVLVEEFLSGTELIIGAKKDAQFGHVILFGIGGVFVEVMKDVSIRLIPIAKKDAEEMVREIKGHKVLSGYRGGAPANLAAIEDALLKVSRMVSEHPEIQEMDINPLFANEKGVVAGDARISLG